MADLNPFQAEVRNLLVASSPYVAINPAAQIVDAYSMKAVAFPRTGLRDSGGVTLSVDQGARYAHDAVLGVAIEARKRSTVTTLAGLLIDAVHGKRIEPTGWRPTQAQVTNEQPVVFFEQEQVFQKVLTIESFLQPAG